MIAMLRIFMLWSQERCRQQAKALPLSVARLTGFFAIAKEEVATKYSSNLNRPHVK
jgi:hypothetical protein